MTAVRVGWTAGLIATAGFLCVSETLLVRPGHPIADRTDVFFQSDAGGLIQDAVWNRNFRARGTHPLVYPLWTRPLHSLTQWCAPVCDPARIATYISRILMAIAAGIGVGTLATSLFTRGVPTSRVLAFALLTVLANGHTLAAIPDHFGLSVGAIGLTFAVLLSDRSDRNKLLTLTTLAPVCFGITVTNVLLPLGLIVLLVIPKWRNFVQCWNIVVLCLILFAAVGLMREILYQPSIQARVRERITMYFNNRLVDDPLAAISYSIRGLSDSVVAPSPEVLRNNLDQLPMLTYERDTGPRPFWPHERIQTVGALVWLGLLAWGIRIGWRERNLRIPVLGAIGWAAGNAAFHNLWGDEYFLYTPHYSLPLIMVAAFGFREIPARVFYPSIAVVVGAALYTLSRYRWLLNGFVE